MITIQEDNDSSNILFKELIRLLMTYEMYKTHKEKEEKFWWVIDGRII